MVVNHTIHFLLSLPHDSLGISILYKRSVHRPTKMYCYFIKNKTLLVLCLFLHFIFNRKCLFSLDINPWYRPLWRVRGWPESQFEGQKFEPGIYGTKSEQWAHYNVIFFNFFQAQNQWILDMLWSMSCCSMVIGRLGKWPFLGHAFFLLSIKFHPTPQSSNLLNFESRES